MISKNYLNILVEQLFQHFLNTPLSVAAEFPNILDFYLNDDELFVEKLTGLTHLVNGAHILNATLIRSLPPEAVIFPAARALHLNNQKDLI